jgi:DNA-binding transcriptional regulator of glucitol operon
MHLVTVAMVVTMVLLGRWQLTVSDRKHFSLQNFGYALQWWTFSAFTIVMWGRLLRDAAVRDRAGTVEHSAGPSAAASQSAEPPAQAHTPVPYRRYVMPNSTEIKGQVADTADPERAAYNDYLAQLAAQDAENAAIARARRTGPAQA